MEEVKDFFKRRCETESDQNTMFLFKTDYEKIKFNSDDEQYNSIRYLNINNLVRFMNPKVNFKKDALPDVKEEILIEDDFDSDLGVVNSKEVKLDDSMFLGENAELKYLYFLPSHIEGKLKDVTRGGKRRRIDMRLKQLIPQKYIEEFNLEFEEKNEDAIVEYSIRGRHATSFYKFFKEENREECTDFLEIEKKVNIVKYKLGFELVESMDYYFIGDINCEIGLLERDISETHDDPLYFHLNMWKLCDENIEKVCSNFRLYPFSKEVIENGN